MTAFMLCLRNVCAKFEEELRRVSADLFSAKIEESFEDGIAKDMKDLNLLTSKVRLLRAKPISLLPQVTEQENDHASVLKEYEDMVAGRIIEGQVVKSITQASAVKTLIAAKNSELEPELVVRKENILRQISDYSNKEMELQQLGLLLKEREAELARVRARWDELLGEMKDAKAGSDTVEEFEATSPLYKKLNMLVGKLELMRWLTCKLVTSRSRGYDWLSDPHRRLTALKQARRQRTVQGFLQGK